MRRILSLFAILFFVTGCGGVEDLIDNLASEFDEYEEEYECYPGNARLPTGTHPEYLITPEGYKWECDVGLDAYLRSNGTFSAIFPIYSDILDYFDDCPGSARQEQTGEWVVDTQGRLCRKYDNIQPGIYGCQRFSYSESLKEVDLLGSVSFYENGVNIGSEFDPYTCTLTEE